MNSTSQSPELASSEHPSLFPKSKATISSDQTVAGLNSPSRMFEYLAGSSNSNHKHQPSPSQLDQSGDMPFVKLKFASADTIPYPLKNSVESKVEKENADFNGDDNAINKIKAKSVSFGSIPGHQSTHGEKKKKKPPVSPLNLAPPGKITNPSQFSHLKSDSSRHSDESLSEEKSDSSSRNTLRSEYSELDKFLEYKKQLDAESGKKPVQQELGKFATFSMKEVRSYLKTKN